MSSRAKTHYLADDTHSLEHASWPKGQYWSTSSGLELLLDEGVAVKSPEALLRENDFETLGRAALAYSEDAETALDEAENEIGGRTYFSLVHKGGVHAGLLQFAYKALVLDRWLKSVSMENAVVIGSPELCGVDQLNWLSDRHDHIYAAIAERMEQGPKVHRVPRVDPSFFRESFNAVPAFDRFFNIVSRPVSAVAYQFWLRLGAFKTPGWRGVVLTGAMAESIEESFLTLAMRGWRIARLDFNLKPTGEPYPGSLERLEKALRSAWERHVLPLFDTQAGVAAWELFWARFSLAIRNHVPCLEAAREFARALVARHARGGKPVVLYSSGLYATHYRLLDAVLREAGVRVVCVDHGSGQGLGRWHDHAAYYLVSFSDDYLCFNEEGKKLFDRKLTRKNQNVHVAGAPSVMTSGRWQRLKRMAARKRLGITGDEPLLMYVTYLTHNNVQMGCGTTTDLYYAGFQKKLVKALGAFKGRVIVKPYPVYRYADPDQIWHMPLPDNMSCAPFGEFRHLRWAADVLVLDIGTSTIAWAITTGLPLVYVDNDTNPMTAHAADRAKDALLYVDARQQDWDERLGDLVSRPLADIRRDWDGRRGASEAFDRDFVTGPRGVFKATLHGVLDGMAATAQSRRAG